METILILGGLIGLLGFSDPKQIGGADDCQYKPGMFGADKEKFLKCLEHMIEHHKLPDKNQDNILSYQTFIELLCSGKISPAEADRLIDHAYTVGNPILFRKPQCSVPYRDYSINLFFIHKDKLPTHNGHLFGIDDDKLKQYVSDPILDWKNKQPDAEINFWYDGKFLTDHQIQSTASMFQNVTFRDIRTIPFVIDNPQMFLSYIAIYYRVDLAKALILDHVIVNDQKKYAVVADGDIVAVIRDQLFDQRTIQRLYDIGILFGSSDGHSQEENSFMILYNNPVKVKLVENPNSLNKI